uniref:Uncharacterized protein n=1 Tax=Neobodo designis TaxID=312471 RepID=A0A7S1W8W1_NEODS
MRRVCHTLTGKAAPSAVAAVASGRGVYSIWGTVVHENNSEQPYNNLSITQRLTQSKGTRGFQVATTPAKPFKELGTLTEPEEYLLSALDDDIERIMSVDWTFDFDSWWADRVKSHESMYRILYNKDASRLLKWVFGNASANTKAAAAAEAKLNYLKSALKWAQESERAYSAIANARFRMQREVFDAFEREKILAGCVVVCDELAEKVPSEFKRKATMDVEWHLNNMRHWVWDAPTAKQTFKRRLA